jgi:hypothetical protein
LIDPVPGQRDTVGFKEQECRILAEVFPAEDGHLDKSAASQHIASGRPADIMVAGHSGCASVKMLGDQFLELFAQPQWAIFAVDEEKLSVVALGVLDPADQLDQLNGCIHIQWGTLKAK